MFIDQSDEPESEEEKAYYNEWYLDASRKLWQYIVSTTEGVAKSLARNPDRDGQKGWIQIVRHFDQRAGVDRLAELDRITSPKKYLGQAKSLEEATVKKYRMAG